MYTDLKKLTIAPENSIQQAISQMEESRVGIVLVVDTELRLLGTITDGDLRRAILVDVDLDGPVSTLLERKVGSPFAQPIIASSSADRSYMLRVLQEHNILHLPLVDEEQRVAGLVTMSDFLTNQKAPLQAVIMAGGMGTRLRPLTEDVPKPMLPVGDRPLLQILVEQLCEAGIRNINVAVNHGSEKIEEHFGDGRDFGVKITYATEQRPLGTAGALGLIQVPSETTLVINGDILTQVDFLAMLAYHREHLADITVAVQRQNFQVPYGVIECEGSYVQALSEKPVLKYFINAGIYLLEPKVYQFIPSGERYDMTELITLVLKKGLPVAAFPVREYWIDIGQPSDYAQANADLLEGRVQR